MKRLTFFFALFFVVAFFLTMVCFGDYRIT